MFIIVRYHGSDRAKDAHLWPHSGDNGRFASICGGRLGIAGERYVGLASRARVPILIRFIEANGTFQ